MPTDSHSVVDGFWRGDAMARKISTTPKRPRTAATIRHPTERITLWAMHDVEIARSLAEGDAAALAYVYDKYSNHLYTYAVSLTGDPASAADVVQDTLLLALARGSQLRDPSKLRPWLLAIARNECMRVLRNSKRTVELDGLDTVEAVSSPVDAELDSADARQLIDAAYSGMSVTDRDVLDLVMRQDLDVGAVATVLGVSANNASAKISRAKAQLGTAVGALLLFRSRLSGCADLRRVVGTEPRFTPLVRKRIAGHVEDCAQCQSSRKRAVSLVALTGLSVLAAPSVLRDRLLDGIPVDGASSVAAMGGEQHFATGPSMPTPQARRSAARLDADRPSFDTRGWPRSTSRHRTMNRRLVALGACASVVVMLTLAVGSLDQDATEFGGIAAVVSAPIVSATSTVPLASESPARPGSGETSPLAETPNGTTSGPSPQASPSDSATDGTPAPGKTPTRPTATASPTTSGGTPTKRPPKDGSGPFATLAPPVVSAPPIL